MGSSWKDLAVELHGRCQAAVARYPGFALDLIEVSPVKTMSNRAIEAFTRRRYGHLPDVEYEFVTDNLLARFHGDLHGYDEFQRLGHDIFRWLRSTDPQLPAKGSYLQWLHVLHVMTQQCPAVGFEVDAQTVVVNVGECPDDLEVFYRPHPYIHSPFKISCAALGMFIEPYQTRFLPAISSKIRLYPWQLACVFANPRIARLTPTEIVTSGLKNAMLVIECGAPYNMPRFIQGPNFSGKLFVGARPVLKLKAGSTAIFPVLNEFEQHSWPDEIETPESLGVEREHLARDVVDKLNRRQKGPLRIHFAPQNSGRTIRWEIVPADPDQ
jgi:hypothetical protein